jgi:hypothetical protein
MRQSCQEEADAAAEPRKAIQGDRMIVEVGHVYRDTVNGHELKVVEVVKSADRKGGKKLGGVYARCNTENGFPVMVETEALTGPRYELVFVPARITG